MADRNKNGVPDADEKKARDEAANRARAEAASRLAQQTAGDVGVQTSADTTADYARQAPGAQPGEGGPVDPENKDTTDVLGQYEPATLSVARAGITSAPPRQPIAMGMGDAAMNPSGGARPAGGDIAPFIAAAIPPTADSIRPKEYPQVENATVMFTKTSYVADRVWNPGEIMHGYTGGIGTNMVETDSSGKPVRR